jgi:hypothetical protein
MANAQHTPGPWAIGNASKRDFGAVTHVGPFDHPCGICEVYGAVDDEPQANARLIAAAPDLLEACEAVLAEVNEPYNFDHDSIAMCRNAIKKAKGE